jgi:hypothetical protein
MNTSTSTQAEQFFIVDRDTTETVSEMFETVAAAIDFAASEFSYAWEGRYFIGTTYNAFAN